MRAVARALLLCACAAGYTVFLAGVASHGINPNLLLLGHGAIRSP
jgi:hypothetical protein